MSVLSQSGYLEIPGASRWLEAAAVEGRAPTSRTARNPSAAAPRLRLRNGTFMVSSF
jgi:hypothetical protein